MRKNLISCTSQVLDISYLSIPDTSLHRSPETRNDPLIVAQTSASDIPMPVETSLLFHREQQQVLEIEAEVCRGRDGLHLRALDRPIRIESKRDECVGSELTILPPDYKGVVLPVDEFSFE